MPRGGGWQTAGSFQRHRSKSAALCRAAATEAIVRSRPAILSVIGNRSNRLALAGGWIDQPFISRHNPKPPGSMVVVQIEPTFRPMDRAGIASGTRAAAMKLWQGKLPKSVF